MNRSEYISGEWSRPSWSDGSKIPYGLSIISGATGSGKTSFLIKTCETLLKTGRRVAYIDIDRSVTPSTYSHNEVDTRLFGNSSQFYHFSSADLNLYDLLFDDIIFDSLDNYIHPGKSWKNAADTLIQMLQTCTRTSLHSRIILVSGYRDNPELKGMEVIKGLPVSWKMKASYVAEIRESQIYRVIRSRGKQ